jgi:hypothetical protein
MVAREQHYAYEGSEALQIGDARQQVAPELHLLNDRSSQAGERDAFHHHDNYYSWGQVSYRGCSVQRSRPGSSQLPSREFAFYVLK